jgi:hypothetical protein
MPIPCPAPTARSLAAALLLATLSGALAAGPALAQTPPPAAPPAAAAADRDWSVTAGWRLRVNLDNRTGQFANCYAQIEQNGAALRMIQFTDASRAPAGLGLAVGRQVPAPTTPGTVPVRIALDGAPATAFQGRVGGNGRLVLVTYAERGQPAIERLLGARRLEWEEVGTRFAFEPAGLREAHGELQRCVTQRGERAAAAVPATPAPPPPAGGAAAPPRPAGSNDAAFAEAGGWQVRANLAETDGRFLNCYATLRQGAIGLRMVQLADNPSNPAAVMLGIIRGSVAPGQTQPVRVSLDGAAPRDLQGRPGAGNSGVFVPFGNRGSPEMARFLAARTLTWEEFGQRFEIQLSGQQLAFEEVQRCVTQRGGRGG